MPHQVAITVKADVRRGQTDALRRLLDDLEQSGDRQVVLPFELLPVHFARFVVIEEAEDLDGNALPAQLIFMSDVDAPLRRYLTQLAGLAADGLDRVFGHCEGYPEAPTVTDRVAWLKAHRIPAAAVYVNTIGRSLEQIRQEAELREAIEDFLDEPGHEWPGRTAADVRAQVRAFVASRPHLRWALRPAKPPSPVFRLMEGLHFVVISAALIALLPVLIVVLPVWLVAVRLQERREVPSDKVPDPDKLDELLAAEDQFVQNQVSALGFAKPGPVRGITMWAALFGIYFGMRHIFNRGTLTGVRTIHFARWVFLDNRRRLIFTSNFDGTMESYMDDFVDMLAWSLNLFASNGVGFPSTRWLIFGGARDEQAYKNFLRNQQIPTQVWYSAYPDLTAVTIANNAAIRAGLNGADDPDVAEKWASRL
ncbi:MAG: hypothetical protein QOD63_1269 [Actinomycetota bacterium]|nr:hypothetical protein [Actinomycetota bacterium]